MSFYLMHRGWMDNPLFAAEVFTEREAWLWLIENAAYRQRPVRFGQTVINLERGQYAASLRFLAEKWAWHRNKVDRFLDRLKIGSMIGTETGTGVTVISITNYDTYQSVSQETGQQQGQLLGQERDSGGTAAGQIRKKVKEGKEGEEGVGRSRNAPAIKLPEDWKPDIGYGVSLGLSQAASTVEATKFVGYFAKGKGSTKRRTERGWVQSWMNWVGKTVAEHGGSDGEAQQQDLGRAWA